LRWSRSVLDLWNEQFAPQTTVSEMIKQLGNQPQNGTRKSKQDPKHLALSVLARDNEKMAQRSAPQALERRLTRVATDAQKRDPDRLQSLDLFELLDELYTGSRTYQQLVDSSTMAADETMEQMYSEMKNQWRYNTSRRNLRDETRQADFDLARRFVEAGPQSMLHLRLERDTAAKKRAGKTGENRARMTAADWESLRHELQQRQPNPETNGSVETLQEQLDKLHLGARRRVQPRESRFKPQAKS